MCLAQDCYTVPSAGNDLILPRCCPYIGQAKMPILTGKMLANFCCVHTKLCYISLHNIGAIPYYSSRHSCEHIYKARFIPQIYTRDPRTCTIFVLAWGSNLGSSSFSHNQNNRGSSGAYVTCIYCGVGVKINTRKTPHGAQRSWMHLYCVWPVWSAKARRPQFEPHDWCHYRRWYRRSGISRVYLWFIKC